MSNIIKSENNATSKQIDLREKVVLLIDASGSMNGMMPQGKNGGLQSKLHAVVEASQVIVQASRKETTLYGIMSFNDEATIYADLTDDYLALYQAAYEIRTQGWTDMHIGIMSAVGLDPHRIILLSDGQPDSHERAIEAAQVCKTLSIKIDTVGIGDADNALLKEIAAITGGIFQGAETVDQLCAVFASLETEARLALTGPSESVIKL